MRVTSLPRKPGQFQQAPTDAQIEGLCKRLLMRNGAAEPVLADEIAGGMFNNTYRIDRRDGSRCVLRISPDHRDAALFYNERYLLRRESALTSPLLSVCDLLPVSIGSDFTGEILPRDAVATEYIAGENWDTVRPQLSAEQNDAVWRQLGMVLRDIHRVPGTHFGWPSPGKAHDTWAGFILEAARGLLGDYARLGLSDDEPRQWLAQVEAGVDVLDQISTPRLVHGDPWPKNVLIRRENGQMPRMVGLLDHERGLWGDPMDEWVFYHLNFPPAFWESYGPRPQGPAAEFRACVYAGLIDEQIVLEAWRYHFDAAPFRQRLLTNAERMRRLLSDLRGRPVGAVDGRRPVPLAGTSPTTVTPPRNQGAASKD
jgi:aminoglycoside phosphotransferase (APT) family kinase protein